MALKNQAVILAPCSVVEHVPARARLSGLAPLGQLTLFAVVPRATIDGHSRTIAPTTPRLVVLPYLGRYITWCLCMAVRSLMIMTA